MVREPQFSVYVSSTMRTPPRSVHGHEYRFVTVKPADFFGLTHVWVTKQQSVMVSDKERTILDALRQPQYAGGISEVANALSMSREDIKLPQLPDYVQHFSSGALRRRPSVIRTLSLPSIVRFVRGIRYVTNAGVMTIICHWSLGYRGINGKHCANGV